MIYRAASARYERPFRRQGAPPLAITASPRRNGFFVKAWRFEVTKNVLFSLETEKSISIPDSSGLAWLMMVVRIFRRRRNNAPPS